MCNADAGLNPDGIFMPKRPSLSKNMFLLDVPFTIKLPDPFVLLNTVSPTPDNGRIVWAELIPLPPNKRFGAI